VIHTQGEALPARVIGVRWNKMVSLDLMESVQQVRLCVCVCVCVCLCVCVFVTVHVSSNVLV
jgi:hypothetical protein